VFAPFHQNGTAAKHVGGNCRQQYNPIALKAHSLRTLSTSFGQHPPLKGMEISDQEN
jgi:hypothetical protein